MVRISNVGLGQPRTKEDLGLQLLSAAQRGRSSEVKRLLAAGAAVSRDMVSWFANLAKVYLAHSI